MKCKGRQPKHATVNWSLATAAAGGSCPAGALANDRPLVLPVDTGSPEMAGFGSKIGWWLSAVALADVLNRSTVFSAGYEGVRDLRHIDPAVPSKTGYNLAEIGRLVHLPSRLRFMRTSSDKCEWMRGGDYVPDPLFDLPARDMYYLPETAYWQWGVWERRERLRDTVVPRVCASRAAFLGAYALAQAELRPKCNLSNPAPRTYLTLHSRRRARARARAREELAHSAPEDVFEDTLEAVARIHQLTRLPWLVLSENATSAELLRARLELMGVATVRRTAVDGSGGHGGCVIGSSTSGGRPGSALSKEGRLVRDFFAIADSSGTLVDSRLIPGWVDSVFSTVAAPTGSAPLMVAAERSQTRQRVTRAELLGQGHDGRAVPNILSGNNVLNWRLFANGNQPLRNVFFADTKNLSSFRRDGMDAFVQAVVARSRT